MSAILLSALLANGWHSVVLHYSAAEHSMPALLLDSHDYPEIVCRFDGSTMIIRWTGESESPWEYEFTPYTYLPMDVRLDFDDNLWLASCPADPLGFMPIFHQTATGWDTLIYPDTICYYSHGFALSSPNVPHLFYVRGTAEYPQTLRHAYLQDTQWVMETLNILYYGAGLGPGMAASSPDNKLYYVYMTMFNMVCGYLEGIVWYEDTVEELSGDTSDFCFCGVWITVDLLGWPHLRYNAYYYGQGYKDKYAFKNALGWHTEFINDEPEDIHWSASLAIDSLGNVHAAKSDPTGIYHMVHYPWDTLWYNLERIDTFPDAERIQIAIDGQGYLHVVFTADNDQKLIYATTSPDVGVSEPPVEPKPSLFLSVSPNPVKGALKLQFGIPVEDEGLVSLKIYDVSGRTVQTIFSEEKSAGYYHLSIPSSSLQAGTFFLRLEAGNKAKTEKVILKRPGF